MIVADIAPQPLTEREKEVARMLIYMRQTEIARELNFSVAYIYEITKRIRNKYYLDNTYALIARLNSEAQFQKQP